MTCDRFSASSLIRSIGSVGDFGGSGFVASLTTSLAEGSVAGVTDGGGCCAHDATPGISKAIATADANRDRMRLDIGANLRGKFFGGGEGRAEGVLSDGDVRRAR